MEAPDFQRTHEDISKSHPTRKCVNQENVLTHFVQRLPRNGGLVLASLSLEESRPASISPSLSAAAGAALALATEALAGLRRTGAGSAASAAAASFLRVPFYGSQT